MWRAPAAVLLTWPPPSNETLAPPLAVPDPAWLTATPPAEPLPLMETNCCSLALPPRADTAPDWEIRPAPAEPCSLKDCAGQKRGRAVFCCGGTERHAQHKVAGDALTAVWARLASPFCEVAAPSCTGRESHAQAVRQLDQAT